MAKQAALIEGAVESAERPLEMARVDVLRERLRIMRDEWEEAARLEGIELAEMRCSILLVLEDFSQIVELSAG